MAVPGTPPTSMITIAPLDDDEDENIIVQETPGRNTTDHTPSPITIKAEPIDVTPTTTTTSTAAAGTTLRTTSLAVPVMSAGGGTGIRLSPAGSNLRSIVNVTRGIFRFSSPGHTVTARSALTGRTSVTQSQPLILIPASGAGPGARLTNPLGIRQTPPFKLIPIQPKSKSQAVVAPQAKQTVVVAAGANAQTHTVRNSLRKGIITFSSENPDELVIGRQETIINPKFGVSGLIFNSRTVTGGGRVKYTKDYLCNLCKHMSDSFANFKTHFFSNHTFSCDYCSYKAFTMYEVVMHTKTAHPEAVEDLKGYEMFEAEDIILGSSATSTVASGTASRPAASAVTSTSGLITVPIVGMSGERLVLQTTKPRVQQSVNFITTAAATTTTTATVAATPPTDKGAADSYFTYKIVYSGNKSEPRKYECDLCHYQTPNLTMMYDHASSHTMSDITRSASTSTTWECYYCNFKSQQQSIVVKHVSAAHPSQHIQLKRYTSTSVIKPLISTSSAITTVMPAVTSPSTTKQPVMTSLLTAVSMAAQSAVEKQAAAKQSTTTTLNVVTSKSKTDSEAKKKKDEEDEDDGTAMWGCYYCSHEDRDRHNVVAHVKADHSGRKIVITRRKMQSDYEEKKLEEKKKEKAKEPPKDEVKMASKVKTKYESLIIKLKTSNKEDQKALNELTSVTQPKSSGSESPGNLPDLSALSDLNRGGSSGEEDSNDMEMPVLEPMRSPRSPRAMSPKGKSKTKVAADGKLKKAKGGTRVKSDLAFDRAEVVFLDHVPEDLNVDVSQLYVFNKSKQVAECNICHRKYTGKMAYGHMREHLMIHTGERIWGCPYCDFRCNRRFALYMHVKKIHPDQPIKLVRRRPYQILSYKNDNRYTTQTNIKYSLMDGPNGMQRKPGLRGPRTHREADFLKTTEIAWNCPHCSRKDVFKGAIKLHMKMVHADCDLTVEPTQVERPLELLRKLTAENQLPMKEAVVKLFSVEDMERYPVLDEILEDNGESLINDLDIDEDYDDEAGTDGNKQEESGTHTSEKTSPEDKPKVSRLSHAKYQCPHCSMRGVRPSTVKMHIITVHPDKELYIHDLRVARRNNQNHMFVCREPSCKFMTIMKQALYAHVAKNPTHVNPGMLPDGDINPVEDMSSRASSLRRKQEEKKPDEVVETSSRRSVTPEPPVIIKEQPAPVVITEQPNPEAIVIPDSPPHEKKMVSILKTMIHPSPVKAPPPPPEEKMDEGFVNLQPPEIWPVSGGEEEPAIWPSAQEIDIRKTPSKPVDQRDPAPGSQEKKRRRVKPSLPENHREGVDLTGIAMVCKYCTIPSTDDYMMLKQHLEAEHHDSVPVVVDCRQRDLRKTSRVHLCPMTECIYATYFEEAFLIHLNEEHEDVMFPFKNQLNIRMTKLDKRAQMRATPKARKPEVKAAAPPPQPPQNESSDEWHGSRSRYVSESSHDDEPLWTPSNRRSRKKTSARSRKPVSRRRPQPRASSQEPEMSFDYFESTGPAPADAAESSQSVVLDDETTKSVDGNAENKAIDWNSEAIVDYPSAIMHVKIRFKCAFCMATEPSLESVKTHLVGNHPMTHTFCLDLHAKHMRKKQTVFVCREGDCVFCCKTWPALSKHLEQHHVDTIDHKDIVQMEDFVECSPLLRNKGKAPKKVRRQQQKIRGTIQKKIVVNIKVPKKDEDDEEEEEDAMEEEKEELAASAVAAAEADSERRKRKGSPRKLIRMHPDPTSSKEESEEDSEETETEQAEEQEEEKASEESGQESEDGKSDEEEEEVQQKDDDENPEAATEEKADESESEESDDEDEESEKEDKEESDDESVHEEEDHNNDEDENMESDTNKNDESDSERVGTEEEKSSPVKSNENEEHRSATMDVMFQCSHCTYLSTDKTNIQSHLDKEHQIQEPEYTVIGAEFGFDGRVNMSVGESKKPENEVISPPVTRIEPLKLRVTTTSDGEGGKMYAKRKDMSDDSEEEDETEAKRAKKSDSSDEKEDESSTSSSSGEEASSSEASSSESADDTSESESESESDSDDSSASKESNKT